jgi:hypothetical protein
MQPNFVTLSFDQLELATGGAVCRRESMGYVNPPGTCEAFWSTAPGFGQNGFQGLDSAFNPLKPDQLDRLNQTRSRFGEPAISPEQAAASSQSIRSSQGR